MCVGVKRLNVLNLMKMFELRNFLGLKRVARNQSDGVLPISIRKKEESEVIEGLIPVLP